MTESPKNPRTTPGVRVALSIAGSDCSGGAGIQADLKTFAALRVFGAAAITAVTAQNTLGVQHALVLQPDLVEQQIDSVAGDTTIHAVKTGMLGNSAVIAVVAKAIERHNLFPLVVDPVMAAKSGDSLIDDSAVKTLVKKLVPLAAVVTPNRHEAARMLGLNSPPADVYAATEAARQVCRSLGARACIVKGIKRPNEHEGQAVDVFCDGKRTLELVADWRPTEGTHGSGCAFSAALAGAMALGQELDEAMQTAKNLVSEAIRQSTGLGRGHSPVNHLAYLDVKK